MPKLPGALDEYSEGLLDTLDAVSLAGSSQLQQLSNVGPGSWVCALIAKADNGNAATVNVGGAGVANFPLAKGEFVAFDVPPAIVIDLGKITVDGKGTAGLTVHFIFVRVNKLTQPDRTGG
ncbi:MAG: hypothetical protein ACLP74_01470 [Thermoplasmata archaeon]